VKHHGKPFYDLVPYLSRPLYSLDYVVSHTVTEAILNTFAPETLLSPDVGERLKREIFERGNTLTLDSILGAPKALLEMGHMTKSQRESLGIVAGI